jgi:hypothetical protein
VTWADAAGPYLAESSARNVRWYLRDHPELAKTVPDERVDMSRGEKVFAATEVSRSLLCFQVSI